MKLRKASALFMAAAMSASMFLTSWQTIQVSRSVGLDKLC